MWRIWLSDVRRGKVIFESDCKTQLNICNLQGLRVNGPTAIGALIGVMADPEFIQDFQDKYFDVDKEVFYIDVKYLT